RRAPRHAVGTVRHRLAPGGVGGAPGVPAVRAADASSLQALVAHRVLIGRPGSIKIGSSIRPSRTATDRAMRTASSMPPFGKVINRAAVIFEGAEPVTRER